MPPRDVWEVVELHALAAAIMEYEALVQEAGGLVRARPTCGSERVHRTLSLQWWCVDYGEDAISHHLGRRGVVFDRKE